MMMITNILSIASFLSLLLGAAIVLPALAQEYESTDSLAKNKLSLSLLPSLNFHLETDCCDDRLFFQVVSPPSNVFCGKHCQENDLNDCNVICGGIIPSLSLGDYDAIEFAFEAPPGTEIQIASNNETFQVVVEFRAVAECSSDDYYLELNGNSFDGGVFGSHVDELENSFVAERSFVKLGRCVGCESCEIHSRVVMDGNGTMLFGSAEKLKWSVELDRGLLAGIGQLDYYYGTDTNATIYTPYHGAIEPAPMTEDMHNYTTPGEMPLPPNDYDMNSDGLWFELLPIPEYNVETGDDRLFFKVVSPYTIPSCCDDSATALTGVVDDEFTSSSCNVTCGAVIPSLDLSRPGKIGFAFKAPEGNEIHVIPSSHFSIEFRAFAECNVSEFVEISGHYFEGGIFGSDPFLLLDRFVPGRSFVKLGRCEGCDMCEIYSRVIFASVNGTNLYGTVSKFAWSVKYDGSIFVDAGPTDFFYSFDSVWIQTPRNSLVPAPEVTYDDYYEPCEEPKDVFDERPFAIVLVPAPEFHDETECCENLIYFRVEYPESPSFCDKECEVDATNTTDCHVDCGGVIPALALSQHNVIKFVWKAPEGKEIKLHSDTETSQILFEFRAVADCDLEGFVVIDGDSFEDGGVFGSDVDDLMDSFVPERSFVKLGRCEGCDMCEISTRIELSGNGTDIFGTVSKVAWSVYFDGSVFHHQDGTDEVPLDYFYGTNTSNWILTPYEHAYVPAPFNDENPVTAPSSSDDNEDYYNRVLHLRLVPAPAFFYEETGCCDELLFFHVEVPATFPGCDKECDAADLNDCNVICGGVISSLDLSEYNRIEFAFAAPEGNEILIVSDPDADRVRVEFQALAECDPSVAVGLLEKDGFDFEGGVYGSDTEQLMNSFVHESSFVTIGRCEGCDFCEIFTRVEFSGNGTSISGLVSKLVWSVKVDGSLFGATGSLDYHYGTDTYSWIRTPFANALVPAPNSNVTAEDSTGSAAESEMMAF
jgi:hypothetical protein